MDVLDDWLQRVAPVAAAGTAAPWVLCRGRRVVGYHALAMGSIERTRAPSRLGRGQPDPVPVLVLARLALDRAEQGTGLGGDLLLDALVRAVAGARQFGARAVVVDAIDDRAGEFYRYHGFLPLEGRRLSRRIGPRGRPAGRVPGDLLGLAAISSGPSEPEPRGSAGSAG